MDLIIPFFPDVPYKINLLLMSAKKIFLALANNC